MAQLPPSGNPAWVGRGGEQKGNPPHPHCCGSGCLEARGQRPPAAQEETAWAAARLGKWGDGYASTGQEQTRAPHPPQAPLASVGSQGEAPMLSRPASSSQSPRLCLPTPTSLRDPSSSLPQSHLNTEELDGPGRCTPPPHLYHSAKHCCQETRATTTPVLDGPQIGPLIQVTPPCPL